MKAMPTSSVITPSGDMVPMNRVKMNNSSGDGMAEPLKTASKYEWMAIIASSDGPSPVDPWDSVSHIEVTGKGVVGAEGGAMRGETSASSSSDALT